MRPGAIASLFALCVVSLTNGEESHLKYLPSDTKAVLTIHFPSLGEPEKKEGAELFDQLYRTHLAPELGKDAKLPLTDVKRIVVAMPYAGSFNGVILVTGKIDRAELEKQMRQVAKSATSLTVTRVGTPAVPVYTRALNEKALLELVPPLEKVPPRFRKLVAPYEAHVAALDGETLMTSLSGRKQIDRALRNRDAKKLRVSDELAAVLKRQDPKDATVGALTDDSLHPGIALIAKEELRETFNQFDHATMRIIGGKEVQFIVEVQGKTSDLGPVLEAKAKRALDALRELSPTLMPDREKRAVLDDLLKSFRITRKGERVTVAGKVLETEWRKMVAPGK
jgi:hypothetical protein